MRYEKRSPKPLACQAALHQLLEEITQVLRRRNGGSLANLSEEMIETYWRIGERISAHEERLNGGARFSDQALGLLAADLRRQFGAGFSSTNLRAMRRFYQNTKHALAAKRLPWSQYLTMCQRESQVECRRPVRVTGKGA